MIYLLNPLKENIWFKVTLACFLMGIFSVGAWILVEDYIIDTGPVALVGLGVFLLILCLALGKYIANLAIKPTDFIAQAVLTVTNQEHKIEPPKLNNLKGPSKEFLIDIINKIYSLNSPSEITQKEQLSDLAYYKAIASQLPLPIIAFNTNQEVTYINEAGLKYLEIDQEQAQGRLLYDIFNISFSSTDTLEDWIQNISQKSVTATETWQRVRLTMSDNRQKKFDMVAHYSQNDPTGIEVILAVYDRTLLYERDDRDLTFVSLAVHELRTPVTILRGYIEVFEDELLPQLNNEQKSFMHNMSASAQHLTSFVSNILNVARVEENALDMQLKEEDWSEVLNQVCKDMELRANVHGKKLVINISHDLPKVAVDRVSIYEVIANIIENSIKYTHTDEEIIVSTHLKDGLVETTITDKGVGIPSNVIGHVFDKFYRSHSSKNSVGGTGLGLFLSKAIVEAHGGQIWVKSKEGHGSTFGFTLQPYDKVADEIKDKSSGEIVRGAHGWIKNHSLYRG